MPKKQILECFPDDVQDVQSRIIIAHQLRASADIQDKQTKQETGWADTSDRATLMRRAADAIEALSSRQAAGEAEAVDFNLSPHDDPAFVEAWMDMEVKGYLYTESSIEKVHLGWLLARSATPQPTETQRIVAWQPIGEWREVEQNMMLKGLRRSPKYYPVIGEVCRVSGPNCDDADGYTWLEKEVLWRDELFIVTRSKGCWPTITKLELALFEPLPTSGEHLAGEGE